MLYPWPRDSRIPQDAGCTTGEKTVANKQLEGQVFSHEGRCYLVMEDNDWDAKDLKVKSVDGRRQITTMPLILIQERLGRRPEQSA